MPRRTTPLALGAALALLAAPAAAQVIRLPARQDPGAWVSLSAGVLQFGDRVDDGTTESAWDFSSAVQFRGALERDRGNNTSYGLVATYARPSLNYTRAAGGVAGTVDAKATVSSLAALFRAGGGAGLHQVIEVSLGARRYAGFRAARSGDALPPAEADVDFTGSLGLGFGYTLGQRATVSIVQDADFAFHQRDEGAASGFDGGIHRSYVTRLGVRLGLGQRRRVR